MATTSSPLSTPPSSDNVFRSTAAGPEIRQYRPTRELPFELAQHVQTYYEETLFTQAFDFLISVVSNSISSLNPSAPVLLPGPPHLALAATIAVHPSLTTRTTARDKWNQANAALRLLRLVLYTAGPINANFCEAFRFTKFENRSSRTFNTNYDDDDEDQQDITFKTRYASTSSMFGRVDDVWSVVGWAFNCSCLPDMHANRWAHWELFLTFMLDLLETDWHLHYAANTTEESLIWHFVELASGGHGRARRIIRAIFADGSTRSLNEFREVFHNELKPPKDEDSKSKQHTAKIDIDKDEYGDYLAHDASDISDDDTTTGRPTKRVRTRTPSRRNTPRSSNESLRSAYEAGDPNTATSATLGPPTALRLRFRLLCLLSHISGHPTLLSTSPTTFPDLTELYTLFVEFIKPLPFPIFQQIVSPSTVVDVLGTDAHSTLCEMILQRMLESSAPDVRDEQFLTVRKMVECYAMFAAGGKGSVAEQARVSLLVEALLRRCEMSGMLDGLVPAPGPGPGPIEGDGDCKEADEKGEGDDGEGERVSRRELVEAIEAGIKRREEKAREYMDRRREGRKGKGSGGAKERGREEEAWRWLRGSGERMRMVLSCVS